MRLFLFLFILVKTIHVSHSQKMEALINNDFINNNDSCIFHLSAINQYTKLKYNNKSAKQIHNPNNELFTPLPYCSFIRTKGSIQITSATKSYIAGHFDKLKFASPYSNCFFIYSSEYQLFLLFQFTISMLESDVENNIISNQNRNNRFSFVDASPIELYVYDSDFFPKMQLMFFTHHTFYGYLAEEFVYKKTKYHKEKNLNYEDNIQVRKAVPFHYQDIEDFFQFIQNELNKSDADVNLVIRKERPLNLFREL